tara:strand:- start:2839 stop:3189 length:351 start_codon:yes stop_codon:yes gene_type:complete
MEKTIFEQITLFNKIRENDGDHYYNMSKSDIAGIIKFLRGEIKDSVGKFKMIMNDCYPEKDLEFFELLLGVLNYDDDILKRKEKDDKKRDNQIPIKFFEDWMFGDDISEEDTEESP